MIKNNSGFSLIEVLIALTILSLLVAPFFNNIVHYNSITRKSVELYRISMEAQSIMEHTKQLNYLELFQLEDKGYISWNDYYMNLHLNCPLWNDEAFLNIGIVFKQLGEENYFYIIFPESVSKAYSIFSTDTFEISLNKAESAIQMEFKNGLQLITTENSDCSKPLRLHLFTHEKDDSFPITVHLNNFTSDNLSLFIYKDLFNVCSTTYYVNNAIAAIMDDKLSSENVEIPYTVYRSEKPCKAQIEAIVNVYTEPDGEVVLRRHGVFNIPY